MKCLDDAVSQIKKDIDLSEAVLSDSYFYNSITFCVIDAVFSIGVRYTSVENTVKRYCDYYNLKRYRERGNLKFPVHENQESLEDLIKKIEELGVSRFTEEIFQNHQRTSTRGGILKTEAVLKFAKCLSEFGIQTFNEIYYLNETARIENRIRRIPGQGSGLSFKYFLMLSGDENQIKPDRMVCRYIENICGPLSEKQVIEIIKRVVEILSKEYPDITPRTLDHEIWKYQRSQDQ